MIVVRKFLFGRGHKLYCDIIGAENKEKFKSMNNKCYVYDNLTASEAKQQCENYNKKFIVAFNNILTDISKFKIDCEIMQELLDWVVYHIKVDDRKLNFKQIVSWFLIPDNMTEISEDYENFVVKLVEDYSYSVEDAMIQILSNQRYKISEFAESRQKITHDSISLGKQFASHFNKVMDEGKESIYFSHHCNELKNFFNQVNSWKFKSNNKRLTTEDLMNWFFTAGQNFEDIVKKPYVEDYDKLVTYLISNRDDFNIQEFLINLLDSKDNKEEHQKKNNKSENIMRQVLNK